MEKQYKTKIEVYIENEPIKTYKSIESENEITENISRFLSAPESTHMRFEIGPKAFEALPKSDILKARIKLFTLQ